MFSFALFLLTQFSLFLHIVNGDSFVSKCGSKEKFEDVKSRHQCERVLRNPLPFNNAHQICRKWGANINATSGRYGQWYWQSCNTNDMNQGCKEIAAKYCPKKWCLIRNGDNCRKVSCFSRFNFKCVRKYWHYGGECPKKFFHIGDRCYYISPVIEVNDFNESQFNFICKKSSGKFNTGPLKGPVLIALQAHISKEVVFPVIANVSSILLGNQSLYPGLPISNTIFSTNSFFQLLCTSERHHPTYGARKREKFEFTGTWSEDKCPKGFYSYNGYTDFCLKLINATNSEIAERKCKESSKESHLVSIRNKFEQLIVHIIRLHVKTDITIGIKRISGGIITWFDGSHSTYQNYQSYKDNSNTHNSKCTTMKDDGTWITSECYDTSTFLCASRSYDFESALLIKKCESAPSAFMSISIDNVCYFVHNQPIGGSNYSRLITRQITEHLINRLKSVNVSGPRVCVSSTSTYLPWTAINSPGSFRHVSLNIKNGLLETESCQHHLYEKFEISHTTPIPKPTTTPTKNEGKLDGLVIALIIAIAVILLFVFVAVGIGICCFCKKTNNAPQSPPPPQPLVPDKKTTHIQMEAPARKTPEPLPKDEEQGVFDDEYEEFPEGEGDK